jgi:hypothetical protein
MALMMRIAPPCSDFLSESRHHQHSASQGADPGGGIEPWSGSNALAPSPEVELAKSGPSLISTEIERVLHTGPQVISVY